MRYLGNKESIVNEIQALLLERGLTSSELSFFDAFCGSGSVADSLKGNYSIIINDILKWSVEYTKGRICAPVCSFTRLGFDPFEFLNGNTLSRKGFFYKTYSPSETNRMYFTPENAARIDYFRWQIEEWRDLLSDEEYSYLLACLIESVSSVSNTAGVYGAFLKKWDPRALKKIVFERVGCSMERCTSLQTFNAKIEDIIGSVDCDILYLDPPYTQNQYGTQYHLLETLILNDEPEVSPITGSRSTAPMRSDWSKEYKANILFDKVLAKTRAKYILLSYSNDGFMSKEYIEASMKRYGKPETFVCKRISYKKYQNWKSQNNNQHFEYLFFVEKRSDHQIQYESPLNYIGSKAKIVPDIKANIPKGEYTFCDVFGGGFNVGINIDSDKIVYNDLNFFVTALIKSFYEYDTYDYLLYVRRVINKFGLEKANAEAYQNARAYYNSLPKDCRDPRLLFAIILYGYQQQIRFNGSHEFNNPVGMRWFNDRVLEKLISFSRAIKEKQIEFCSDDYKVVIDRMVGDIFVYLDPPYKLTTGAYNDGKRGFNGWNEALENELFAFLDDLTQKNTKFMLSYVITHRGKTNDNLLRWISTNNYRTIHLGDVIGISGSRRQEVLIVNYE